MMLENILNLQQKKEMVHNRSKSSSTFLNVSVECDKFIVEEEDVSVV